MAATYPFDPTGVATTNRVTNENQALSPGQYRDFRFIVPNAAPFYADSVILRRQGQSQPLVEGVDYFFSHKYVAASYSLGKRIYGSISFYDESLVGNIINTYQTVGGEWTLDDQKILEILGNAAMNPRVVAWDEVTGYPEQFPPIYHNFEADDLVNFNEMVSEIQALAQALQFKETGLSNHLIANNPHNITKATIGLDQVQNFPRADAAVAVAGLSNAHYMTPFGTQLLINNSTTGNSTRFAGMTLQEFIDSLTSSSVGLGDVNNYPVANTAQAEAGDANNVYMTALRVKEAINALVPGLIDTALNNADIQVTKEAVGLGNVENYAPATLVDFQGAVDDRYATSAGVNEYITSLMGSANGLASLDATGKLPTAQLPALTKTMVGLGDVQNLPLATQVIAEAMNSNAHYLTPLSGYWMASKRISDWYTGKLANLDPSNLVHTNDDILSSTQGYRLVLGMRGSEADFASSSSVRIPSMAFLKSKLDSYVGKGGDQTINGSLTLTNGQFVGNGNGILLATSSRAGTVRMRRSGSTLYIRTDGNNA